MLSAAVPRLLLSLMLAACAPVAAWAQAAPATSDGGDDATVPRATGDAWLDRQLADIDRYAQRYPEAFADEIERHAGVPRAYTQALVQQQGWAAGDVWFACFLARAVDATCRSVVRTRATAGDGADWEAVAADFDAAPRGPAYRTLRLALADSYLRWARPLEPDAALRRALRERDQARARAEAARAR